jgi:hypothetical protein
MYDVLEDDAVFTVWALFASTYSSGEMVLERTPSSRFG